MFAIAMEVVFELYLTSEITYCFVHVKEEMFCTCSIVHVYYGDCLACVLSFKYLSTFRTLRNNKVLEVFSVKVIESSLSYRINNWTK